VTGDIEWVFDKPSANKPLRGGDPSEHAFEQDLSTFVREVLQNSSDAGTGTTVEVDFELRTLSGEELNSFFEAVSWDQLQPHLEAVANRETGASVETFLDSFAETGTLRVLTITDRNTVGLTGEEFGEDSNFTALCRNTLDSQKDDDTAGGTYGLGKSVHWAFSGARTVFFNSLPTGEWGAGGERLFGRTELPSHPFVDNGQNVWYEGPGFFGNVEHSTDESDRGGKRAASVRGDSAARRANALGIGRTTQGTTVAIVGFRDPTSDEARTPAEVRRDIAAETERSFWPAMCGDPSQLAVNVVDTPDSVERIQQTVGTTPLRAAYQTYLADEAESALLEPGDVVTSRIPLSIPAKRDGTSSKTDGSVTLVVRLGDESDSEFVHRVAMFRKPRMVVKYWDKSRVTLEPDPFHAILVCGEAKPEHDTEASDSAVEEFLRLAEPPAHDEWGSTQKLRNEYKRGYKKALEEMKSDVSTELRDLIQPEPTDGERGPDKLRRQFPMQTRSRDSLLDASSGEQAFHFSRLSASFTGDRWEFSGVIEPNERVHNGWECAVKLYRLGEDGSRLRLLSINRLHVEDPDSMDSEQLTLLGGSSQRELGDYTSQKGGVSLTPGDPEVTVTGGEGVQEVYFEGESEQIDADAMSDVGEIELRVTGTLTTEVDS
jgi:hypothetical protein